ncbi:MAG TPA: hypothetical protein EYP22_04195 [Methanosarcinales archaeon]|nr:hypothetical protein [Methanosarcinales archaeon]
MAEKAINALTGLEKSEEQRFHFDIYAVFEGSQELYFGHETQININMVETVKLKTVERELEKCYLSPTKRRGIERRSLIWAPMSNGLLLGDNLGCGIPHTCGKTTCPICSVFGALIPRETKVKLINGKEETRKATTLIGRVVHGGGVAIQDLDPEIKQRAMHPSMIKKEGEDMPNPFKIQYNEPSLLYPVYNHCLSITETEFGAVAYAFLDSLARLGAGNPKGVKIFEYKLFTDSRESLIVLDKYRSPLGKRPVISPFINNIEDALNQFKDCSCTVFGNKHNSNHIEEGDFERWIGDTALTKLQEYASEFVKEVLNA